MSRFLKYSTYGVSGVAVAAGLAVWILIPPPPTAIAKVNKDQAECFIENLREVSSDKAATYIVAACQSLH